ncbi:MULTISPECIES: hypothetical protein [unclassified Streptomyces]|jgi:hypothetical protein|uniref:hypothetical protein n=1 Tax=unclassified Streptomyces TaxID=2593676 RepID=UPI0029A45B8C|nr:hypothetical protein [Streptomyces sp. PA03-2a]MDX2732513.1 hypothetical protein [Streptomyces sp. PA03-2a]
MLMPTHAAEPYAPTAGLIASLATTTWLDTDPSGAPPCCLLLVPQPPRGPYETLGIIERRMHAVATALSLGPTTALPPDIGPRLRPLSPTSVTLRIDSTLYRKRVPTSRPWLLLLRQQTPAALVLGLDPLSRAATPAEIDTYLDRTTQQRRLLFGLTRAE